MLYHIDYQNVTQDWLMAEHGYTPSRAKESILTNAEALQAIYDGGWTPREAATMLNNLDSGRLIFTADRAFRQMLPPTQEPI